MIPTLASGPRRPVPCPIGFALGMISGKWKPAILGHLAERTLRFGELERRLPHVSRKVLIEQLRDLERDGLVSSRVFAQVPPRVEYSLTPLGHRVLPILSSLGEFGQSVLVERAAAVEPAQAPEAEAEAAPLLATAG